MIDLFDYAERYPHRPGAKEATTSADAAAAMASRAPTLRDRALAALQRAPAGMTADEVADALGEGILSIRPRISELKRLGLIEATKERRANSSGLDARVWRARGAT
jgi:hypothetical protein